MRPIHPDDYDPRLLQFFQEAGVFNNPSLSGHVARYLHSWRHMPRGEFRNGSRSRALEIGTTFLFPVLLTDYANFEAVDVTDFQPALEEKIRTIQLPFDKQHRAVTAFNIDLEKDKIPARSDTYDLVLCFEVIEHMEIDPMHMMGEINRVLKPQGLCFLSTPNSISARNVEKILNGYAPHFFMKYDKNRQYNRHNIEYAPHQIEQIMRSAGFNIQSLWTRDTFEESLPRTTDFLRRNAFMHTHRGDTLFVIGQKESGILNRYPDSIYF